MATTMTFTATRSQWGAGSFNHNNTQYINVANPSDATRAGYLEFGNVLGYGNVIDVTLYLYRVTNSYSTAETTAKDRTLQFGVMNSTPTWSTRRGDSYTSEFISGGVG